MKFTRLVNKGFLLFICFMITSLHFHGQSKKNSILILKQELEESYQEGDVTEMLKPLYQLFQKDTVIPDEAAYFLGYVMFKKEQYGKSRTALLKYVKLTKEEGKHYDSTVVFMHYIDKTFGHKGHQCSVCETLGPLEIEDTCTLCLGVGQTEDDCSRCDGLGYELCPVCGGIGFEKVSDPLKDYYIPCRTCHQKGTITCAKCEGTLKEKNLCVQCAGDGLAPRERVCNHQHHNTETGTLLERINSWQQK